MPITIFSYSYCRFSAVMKREFYPSEAVLETLGEDTLYQPGHTVTLLPPLTIVNLLPVDLGYLIANTAYTGKLKPGKKTTLHQVSLSIFLFLYSLLFPEFEARYWWSIFLCLWQNQTFFNIGQCIPFDSQWRPMILVAGCRYENLAPNH